MFPPVPFPLNQALMLLAKFLLRAKCLLRAKVLWLKSQKKSSGYFGFSFCSLSSCCFCNQTLFLLNGTSGIAKSNERTQKCAEGSVLTERLQEKAGGKGLSCIQAIGICLP